MTSETSPEERPIPRRRLYEEVERRIEDEIRDGRLRAGDAIPAERDLMLRFGVGRPSIRDALLSLSKKGLVRVGAGERTRVSRPTFEAIVQGVSGSVALLLGEPKGVRDLQHARRFFECALVRLVAVDIDKAGMVRLRARLEANQRALDDPVAFERTDVGFHYELALLAGNPIFAALHQATVGWLTQQRSVSLMQRGALKAAHRFHARIFDAIAAHDPDAAEEVMSAHLLSVERYYWRTAKDRN